MSVIDTLITNRAKGAKYNYTDLNRVEAAVAYLTALYNQIPDTMAAYIAALGVAPDSTFAAGYDTPISLTTKTDWAQADEPTITAAARYIANINTLRNVVSTTGNIPDTPGDLARLTYAEANNIETILFAINSVATATETMLKKYADCAAEGFRYCGTFTSGQGVILP